MLKAYTKWMGGKMRNKARDLKVLLTWPRKSMSVRSLIAPSTAGLRIHPFTSQIN